MKEDDFYVGYVPQAPEHVASVVKKVIFFIFLLVVCVSTLIVWCQKKFSTSNFEYGINTTLEGYIFMEPVPHIVLPLGSDSDGREIYQNILLVGFGKTGAKEVIENLQQNTGKSFIGSKVKLTGSLIYGDGKALMQITEEDNTVIVPGHTTEYAPVWNKVGSASLSGEVVDPKCYFGVMKPGEGKAHRACAIRCIAGGIPPVFHSTDTREYFLLVNEASEPLNNEVLTIVGDQIKLDGLVLTWNDWKILKVNTTLIRELSLNKNLNAELIAFEEGMTQCKNE